MHVHVFKIIAYENGSCSDAYMIFKQMALLFLHILRGDNGGGGSEPCSLKPWR